MVSWMIFISPLFRKSLWWWRSLTTTRSARTTPSGRSSSEAKPRPRRWSTGPTCWRTRADPSLSGIPFNPRKISTALSLLCGPRSNLLNHSLTNPLTHRCMTPHSHPYALHPSPSHHHIFWSIYLKKWT